MTTKKKDLKRLSIKELFDYLRACLKKSQKENPADKLIETLKRKWETN